MGKEIRVAASIYIRCEFVIGSPIGPAKNSLCFGSALWAGVATQALNNCQAVSALSTIDCALSRAKAVLFRVVSRVANCTRSLEYYSSTPWRIERRWSFCISEGEDGEQIKNVGSKLMLPREGKIVFMWHLIVHVLKNLTKRHIRNQSWMQCRGDDFFSQLNRKFSQNFTLVGPSSSKS